MIYYSIPARRAIAPMKAGLLGAITTPRQGNLLPADVPFCADNGAFGQDYPGDDAWWVWLQRQTVRDCVFAVAPDVPFDALATLDKSLPWLPQIRSIGLAAALVAQNGFEHIAVVPWDELDVLFLGGTMECLPCGYIRPATDRETKRCASCNRRMSEWKEGAAARELVCMAKSLGKQVHMGRVNSEERLRYAHSIGCDSADGTYLKYGPDKNLLLLLGWLRSINHPISDRRLRSALRKAVRA